ncbi:GNAT family N-acetyltransferase [Kineococcus sp. NUM-3379]
MPTVRPAEPADLPLLPALEAAADGMFAAAGLVLPPCVGSVEDLRTAACVLVAGRPPAGFVRLEVVDGLAHVEQLAVLPSATGRGTGSALLAAAAGWARGEGRAALTLTTFRDVPWNGPFYRRRGFRELAEPGPELRAVRAAEAAAGLDALSPRTAMVLPLRSATPPG